MLAPSIAIWLNILYAILTGLSAAALQTAGVSNANEVVAIAALIAMPINVILHAYSSPQPGPLVNLPPPPAAPTTTAKSPFLIGLLALVLLALAIALAPHHAHAQGRRALGNPLNLLGSWADQDVQAAIAASTAFPSLQDNVGQACWTQISTLAALVKAHPLPATFHLATDIEYARLDQAALNEICRNPSCAQVWSDMANNAQALSVLPLPFSFTSLCAKVPVVGLGLPAPTPAPSSK